MTYDDLIEAILEQNDISLIISVINEMARRIVFYEDHLTIESLRNICNMDANKYERHQRFISEIYGHLMFDRSESSRFLDSLYKGTMEYKDVIEGNENKPFSSYLDVVSIWAKVNSRLAHTEHLTEELIRCRADFLFQRFSGYRHLSILESTLEKIKNECSDPVYMRSYALHNYDGFKLKTSTKRNLYDSLLIYIEQKKYLPALFEKIVELAASKLVNQHYSWAQSFEAKNIVESEPYRKIIMKQLEQSQW